MSSMYVSLDSSVSAADEILDPENSLQQVASLEFEPRASSLDQQVCQLDISHQLKPRL